MAKCTASGVVDGVGWTCDRNTRTVRAGRRGGAVLCNAHYVQNQRHPGEFTPIKNRMPPFRHTATGYNHDPNDMLCDVPEGHRRCLDCLEIKPLGEFLKNKQQRGDKMAECKTCHRWRHLDYTYGMGAAQWFQDTFAAQGYKCALCESTTSGGRNGAFHLDHDHSKPKGAESWRMVLCITCNHNVGNVENRGYNIELAAKRMRERGIIKD